MAQTDTGDDRRSPSPPTRRVIEIVALLTATPTPLPVTAVSARLGIARATATAILAELEDADWVTRGHDGGYRIGPALPCGPTSLPPAVGDLLHRLAVSARAGATLSRIEPSGLTVLDLRHGPDRRIPGIPPGHRIPLRHPAGASVMPWRPVAERDRWLAEIPATRRRDADALLALVEERGFALFRPRSDDAGLVDLLSDLLTAAGSELVQPALRGRALRQLAALTSRPYTAVELDDEIDLPLSYLAAPVFGTSGTADHEVQLGPLRSTTTKAERDAYIARTLDCARAMSAALGPG